MTNDDRLACLSDEQLEWVDAASAAFEAALRQESSVSLESHLDQAPEDLRAIVFGELLAAQIEWTRSRSGEWPEIADYLNRFPRYANQIHAVFAEEQSSEAEDSNRSTPRSQPLRKNGANLRLLAGTIIDHRYTLREVIGEGGMGTVYLADQHHPVVRQVAVKFVKGGLDSKSVLAKFDLERRALAIMDHPGIARVFDGGQTDSGVPYFVMELVRGVSVTDYCDQHRLSLEARLKLFVSICQAVQHAHLKGIIHRDLKPGNVLVVEVDGRPMVKVIDFGMAKATQPDGETVGGNTWSIAGTPTYMSPEQTTGGSHDIDSRTDIYSLGIILYELLIGETPHAFGATPSSSIWDVLRLVRDSEATRPSDKFKQSEKQNQIASQRDTEAPRLIARLKSELDWIVLKALEKDRNRRYDTVSGLAQDIERHLNGEIVEARPPSQWYRVEKLVKRHRKAVVGVALLLLTLVAGIVGTAWGMFEAQREATNAQREAKEKEQARKLEQQERQYAEAIAEFVERDFLQLTNLYGRLEDGQEFKLDKESSLSDLLDRANQKLDQRADLSPRIEAHLRWIIGISYKRLGNYPVAIKSLERSTVLNEQSLGRDDVQSLLAVDQLADAYRLNGQYDEADRLLTENIARKQRLLGDTDQQTLVSLELMADNHRAAGRPAVAVEILEKVLAVRKSNPGVKDRRTLVTMYSLAQTFDKADRSEEAQRLLEQTLELQLETIHDQHPDVHASRELLGSIYNRSGAYEKARPLLEEGLAWTKSNFVAESPEAMISLANLAGVYRNLKRWDEAIDLGRQCLELTQKVFEPDHPNVANAQSDLGRILFDTEQFAEALHLFETAAAAREQHVGLQHASTLRDRINMASCLRSLGRADEAFQLSEQNLGIARELLGENHSQTVAIKQGLAVGYWQAKQLDRSVPLFEEILGYWETRSGRRHPQTLTAMANLGVNLRDAGRFAEAIPLLEEVYQAVPENPTLDWIGMELLDAYLWGGGAERAAVLQETFESEDRTKFAEDPVKLSATLASIGRVLLKHELDPEAELYLQEAATLRLANAPETWSTYDTLAMLGECYLKQQNHVDAESTLIAAATGMAKHATANNAQQAKRRITVIKRLILAAQALDHAEIVAQWSAELESP
ncbi:MAG: serine/threonine-protein kinase [Pirellulaceae bacterium]|nr:serine/threonine-protein kinase [Pirellulaceae bacterium]